MTILQYLLSTKVAVAGEFIALKKADPEGYATLVQWAREQATNEGIVITDATSK